MDVFFMILILAFLIGLPLVFIAVGIGAVIAGIQASRALARQSDLYTESRKK